MQMKKVIESMTKKDKKTATEKEITDQSIYKNRY